ncbi:L-aspartate oxidase [Ketobacter sp. MCCC 1A13808]|uniref:L-aspartate oxidase n=1 Tax=Ketobacter sp. MCCC 1A13808 TaxID=2602738 RepID=UPI000F22F8EA|nr:L-aspartate oxidase [Ketobacter sp. MCCC 1A13808]MVF14694.1 L-aspartate oxidase [Ketobacter sp. MCCC 1A13808]RLP53938.1 MAG: L-aspartate oxidase [Ketobacter sp.]
MTRFKHDILVIGSGAAGLTAALHLAPFAKVGVLSKGPLTAANTYYAQGGVAAVLDEGDSLEAHINDTLEAGDGLCREDAVRFTVENGPDAIRWLIKQGVGFTREVHDDGRREYHLTREGGHSHRRVIHAADATGLAISSTLIDKVRQQSNVSLFESRVAIDLITSQKLGQRGKQVFGAYVLNNETGEVEVHEARFVFLGTGGSSKTYLYTSNPDVATGDGIAMAWRAGCRVGNMEFNQFHPTCLYHPEARSFLITEAIRGEGGLLRLPSGERFMDRFHKMGELAPRDIVARAIDHEMKRLGVDCLYLDITHKPEAFIRSHFPTVFDRCKSLGINIAQEPIPIVPAAHYTCGGVLTDLNGRTDLGGLYAVGETAFTGLHGANRMASNSLLECMVFAIAASKDIHQQFDQGFTAPTVPDWDESQVTHSDEAVVISHNWDELRRFMWDYVGIVRTDKRLQRATHRINMLKQEILEYYNNFKVSNDLIELRNLVQVAELIVRCALSRQESRGLHYTLDYPDMLPEAKDTILVPGNYSSEAWARQAGVAPETSSSES